MQLSERFYDALAAYVAGLPQEWIDRIAFFQPSFGSTGDRNLYKEAVNDMDADDYLSVMQTLSTAFRDAFQSHPETQNIRFLWNVDDYDGSDPSELEGKTGQTLGKMLFAEWARNNFNVQLRKQQVYLAQAYQLPGELSADIERRDDYFGLGGRWDGNPEFVRGESAGIQSMPFALKNLGLNWYWVGIASVDQGLDAWEAHYSYYETLLADGHEEGMYEGVAFSNRYSFRKKAATSPYAFIALRRGLDFKADEFSSYGSTDSEIVTNILAEFAPYGAKNDDNYAALNLQGIGYQGQATGLNDCVKNIITRNYSRFITQIDPNETSAAYWRVGLNSLDEGSRYGRFARGFDVANGKNAMYFDVDDEYYASGDGTLTLKVIYYAEDTGSWELKYHAQDGSMKTALSVTNSGPGTGWGTEAVIVTDALLNNGDPIKGADLVLVNAGGTDCRFHMIETSKDDLTLPPPPEGEHARITSPAEAETITTTDVHVAATGYAAAGIEKMTFQIDGNDIGTDFTPTYEYTFTDLTPIYEYTFTGVSLGAHTLTVERIDESAVGIVSDPVVINVSIPDHVIMESPINNQEFLLGAPVAHAATGFAAAGIKKMRFSCDGVYDGTDLTPPYEYTHTGLSLGQHTLQVQMVDNLNNKILSDTAVINVVTELNNAPTFTADPFSKPNATENSAYTGQTIAGSATDPDVGDTLTYSKVGGPEWLSVAVDGALSGTPTNADVGLNVFPVQVDDGRGGADTAFLEITVDSAPTSGTLTLNPTDDTWVLADNPTVTRGTSAILRVRGDDPAEYREPFLKFNVTGLTAPVTSAKLRVYSIDVVQTVNCYEVADTSWTEGTMTWNDKPAVGPQLDSLVGAPATWCEWDVTSYITGDGLYSFGLQGTAVADDFSSKEGANPPELVIDYGGNNSPDINGDGDINFEDFEIISRYWLLPCAVPNWCEGADLDLSGLVNLQDLKTFTQNWDGSP